MLNLKAIISCLIILSTITSCKDRLSNRLNFSLKDSVLKEHLLAMDSIPYYDTTEINYKVLKAYQNNDTTFFKSLRIEIQKESEYRRRWENSDSCVHLKKINELNADEAYRFFYYPAFCPSPIIATITKRDTNINLHFIVYQSNYDTISCKIITEFNKKLTMKNWEDFSSKLGLADIWGLKRENGMQGFDGTTIRFIGYQKSNPYYNQKEKVCYVHRWEVTTLRDAFDIILKVSKNKKGCVWIEEKSSS